VNRYDTTFILSTQTSGDGLESAIKRVADLITSGKGQVLRENRIGSRKLAYPIRKQQQGYYVSFIYEANTEVVKKLDLHFKLDESCMRHLTIAYPGDPFRQNVSEQFAAEFERRPRRDSRAEGEDGGDMDDDGRRRRGRGDRYRGGGGRGR